MSAAFVHPTALVEEGVTIGSDSAIWDHVHIRAPATIGSECIVGGKTYISYGVSVGDRVKINSFVYLCTGVTLDDGVMVAAHVTFTNDRYPRATTPDLHGLRPSEPDESTRDTYVRRGATVGAGAVIGCDLEIGEFAMVGMGSVVTGPIGPYHLVAGNPARPIGFVCRCGVPLVRFGADEVPGDDRYSCSACAAEYEAAGLVVRTRRRPRSG